MNTEPIIKTLLTAAGFGYGAALALLTFWAFRIFWKHQSRKKLKGTKTFAAVFALAAMFGAAATPAQQTSLKDQAVIQSQKITYHRKKKGLLASGNETPGAPQYDRLDFWRHTKRTSYRTIQHQAHKRKKQRAKSPK